ncbi:g6991 [Coccomyxa elongata]
MSGAETKQSDAKRKENKGFECAEEAAALLNCVTDKNYNEMRCLPLLKKLRACVEKKNVVDFKLLPEKDTS